MNPGRGQKLRAHQILTSISAKLDLSRATLPDPRTQREGHNGGDALPSSASASAGIDPEVLRHHLCCQMVPPNSSGPNSLRALEALAQESNCTILEFGYVYLRISFDIPPEMWPTCRSADSEPRIQEPHYDRLDELHAYNGSSLREFRASSH